MQRDRGRHRETLAYFYNTKEYRIPKMQLLKILHYT